MLEVLLLPLGPFPAQVLSDLAQHLERQLELPVTPGDVPFPLEDTFDARRDQYRSDLLLERLQAHPTPAARVLGVTEADLFIPVLTFVFGEAQLGGRAAVVSTYRLRNEVYGLPPDRERLEERLLKEAMHELGHTFGLLHCYHTGCVMQASTYAESVDLKPAAFCRLCRSRHEAFQKESAPVNTRAQSLPGRKPEKAHELLS